MSVADLEHQLDTFRFTAFRLETLQAYRNSGEDEWIAAFEAGAAAPPHDPVQDDWEAMIRRHRAAGRVMQRVHVVLEPVSAYLRFELTWSYAPNVAAGEDVRIIPVTSELWPAEIPRARDFWLFDSSVMFDAQYDEDGGWLGVERVTDPGRIVEACRQRDAALHLGQPWQQYMQQHPQLAARIPAA